MTFRLRLVAALAVASGLAASPAGLPAAAGDAHAKPRTYKTPGYRGVRRAPKTEPQTAPQSIVLAGTGSSPQVVVDAAGTGHVVWTEDPPSGPNILRYCRLRRRATACDNPAATQRFVPDQTGPNTSPEYNTELGGPRVLAAGDDVVLMTHRYPNVTEKPDGTGSDRSTYVWISDDGGESFTGPGLIGDAEPSGDAVVFGPPEAPVLGVISDTRTGGTFFQAVSGGRYTGDEANLGDGGPDRAYNGSLAVADGKPIAAFTDLGSHTFIRAWTGAGDPNDASTWTTTQIDGDEPALASGPRGAFLLGRLTSGAPFVVRKLNGTQPGPPVAVSKPGDAFGELFQDEGGILHAVWVDRTARQVRLIMRESSDGAAWSGERALAQADGIVEADLGAAFDGGGFATFVRNARGSQGEIAVAPFGVQTPTGRKGLGGLPGGGADPSVVSSCTKIAFGAVEILAQEGCLLGAVGKRGVKVSEGPLQLNGLELAPDPGVKIVVDPRARTIDTTGVATLLARGADHPVVIYRGELHLKLDSAGEGALLGSFPGAGAARASAAQDEPREPEFPELLSQNARDRKTREYWEDKRGWLKGFPAQGSIDAILGRDGGIRIPLHLGLPKRFGGITADATLLAKNGQGLKLDSLKISVKDVLIGPVELKKLSLDYTRDNDRWDGKLEVRIPPPKLGGILAAEVTFEKGNWKRATVKVPLPPPGVPVASGVFLTRVGGGFGIDPLFIQASLTLTAIRLVHLDGSFSATFPDGKPARFEAKGTLSLVEPDFEFADASALFTTDGYFESKFGVHFNWKIAEVKGSATAVVDGKAGTFGAAFKASLEFLIFNTDGDVVISSRGIGACAKASVFPGLDPIEGGFIYRWHEGIPDGISLSLISCDLHEVEIKPRKAQAGATTFTVARGARAESLEVRGSGGPPRFTLVSPSGERVAVAPRPAPGAKAWGMAVPETATTVVGLPSPQPGTWRIEPEAGSPPIANVHQRTDTGPPEIKARLARARGGKHVLTYDIERQPGLRVRFVERGREAGGELGVVNGGRGKLRFGPEPGRPGSREIVAQIERDGVPTGRSQVVARYTAPKPRPPARVRKLRVSARRGRVVARWAGARRADRYVVRVSTSRGGTRQYMLSGRKRVLRPGRVRRGDRVRVTVRGMTAAGVQGPVSARGARHRRR